MPLANGTCTLFTDTSRSPLFLRKPGLVRERLHVGDVAAEVAASR